MDYRFLEIIGCKTSYRYEAQSFQSSSVVAQDQNDHWLFRFASGPNWTPSSDVHSLPQNHYKQYLRQPNLQSWTRWLLMNLRNIVVCMDKKWVMNQLQSVNHVHPVEGPSAETLWLNRSFGLNNKNCYLNSNRAVTLALDIIIELAKEMWWDKYLDLPRDREIHTSSPKRRVWHAWFVTSTSNLSHFTPCGVIRPFDVIQSTDQRHLERPNRKVFSILSHMQTSFTPGKTAEF
jgi:hypothetical protein